MPEDTSHKRKSKPGLDLERLRIRLLYDQSAIAQATALLNAGIYVYVSKDLVSRGALAWWSAFVIALYIIRQYGQWRFRVKIVNEGKSFDPVFWENMFVSGCLLSGITWGVAGTLLLPTGSIFHHAFLGFLLAGTTAGALVAYSSSIRAVQAFLLPATVPLAICLAREGNSLELSMAFLIALYTAMTSVLTLRVNKYVTESLHLRFEKDHLLHELQDAQARVTEAAKMSALGLMAGAIAHEINTPLATINLTSGLLREYALKNELTAERAITCAGKISETVERIAKIIRGLRTFTRERADDPFEDVSMEDLISETLEFCQGRFTAQGIAVTVNPMPKGIVLKCRRVQISQILLNLLNNAFDAVEGQPCAWVRIEGQQVDNHATLAVVDSGPGVLPEVRDKIMQPFFTTKDIGRGTGLGLSIACEIIKNHGGTLELDASSPFTRFVVTFPLAT